MILIIGSKDEFHSNYIFSLLTEKKEDVCYFDTVQIPENILINWEASSKKAKGNFVINGTKVDFCDIKSVYWRQYSPITPDPSYDNHTKYMIERELKSAFDSAFSALDCLWVNSLYAIELHKQKSYQLHLMAKNGIRVPDTLITSDSASVADFFYKNNEKIIFKPVRGGAYTKKMTKNDLFQSNLESLKNSPVQFQELIEGVDVRVYAFKDELFAAIIQAQTLDFREDLNAKIIPIDLPEHVASDCFKILKLLNLEFSGIDIRLTPEGEFVFIEANPAPMFYHFEKMSKFPISEKLCNLLIRGKQAL